MEGFEDAVPLFDYWTSPSLGSPFDVRVLASSVSEIRARLASHFVSVEVVVPDIQTLIDNEAAGRASSRSNRWLPGEYHSTDQINTYFRDTAVPNYAQIASTFSIGTSTEGRDLQVVRITGGPKNTSCSYTPAPACKPSYNGKPAIWFQSTIHAREWLTGASAEVMVDKILKDYATDASIRQMVDSLDLYFLIIANPDGYEYSRDTDRWWRKTRSPNAGSSCVGTDPNRNWAHRAWGGVPGSSTNPCSDVYHGSRAGSEPEVERIQQFVTQFGTEADGSSHFKLFIDYHTYSQMWLYPWGYLYSAAPHDDEHDALSAAAVAAIRGVHGKQYTYGPAASTIYVTTGDSTDWAYDPIEARPPTPDWAYIKHAYTIEGRDTGGYGFVAPASEIVPASEEIFAGLRAALRFAVPTNLPPSSPSPPTSPPAPPAPPPSPPPPVGAGSTCAAATSFGDAATESNSFSVVVPIAVGVSSPSYNPSQCVSTQFTGQDPVYWLKLEDVRPGVALELTACGFDTDLSIFRGSCDSLEQVACDGDSLDDEGSCSVSYGSLIDTVLPEAGVQYYIVLGGFNGDTGTATLTGTYAASSSPSPPPSPSPSPSPGPGPSPPPGEPLPICNGCNFAAGEYWNGVTCGTLEELFPPRICTACDYPTEVWNGQACVLLSDYVSPPANAGQADSL